LFDRRHVVLKASRTRADTAPASVYGSWPITSTPMMHKAARAFVEPLLHQLRHGESSRVITRLEQILSEPSLQGHPAYDNSADPQLERQIQYFLNHRDHLDYQAVAERGAPIGSGAVESQCSQFQDRFKRTGPFWIRPGLRNLLALGVMIQNNTFAYLWN